jgi:hypothetical protein
MARKNHPFKGELAKPIRIQTPRKPTISLLEEDSENAEKMRLHQIAVRQTRTKATLERLSKLSLLLEHYGLKNECNEVKWLLLVMKLAEDYVPGFQIEERKTVGRKKSWTDHELFMLYFQVRARIEATKSNARTINITDVCKTLLRTEPWKNKGFTVKVLQNKYTAASRLESVEVFEKLITLEVGKQASGLEKIKRRQIIIDALITKEKQNPRNRIPHFFGICHVP